MAFPISHGCPPPGGNIKLSPAGRRCSPQVLRVVSSVKATGSWHSDLLPSTLGSQGENVSQPAFVSSLRGAPHILTRRKECDTRLINPGTLHVRAAGRSKAAPRARPKPSLKWQRRLEKRPGGVHKTNLHRRGRRVTLDPNESARKLLESPQLSAEALQWPLLAACLSPVPLTRSDEDWIIENIDEVKEALGLLGGPEGWGEDDDETDYDELSDSYAESDDSEESEDREDNSDQNERGKKEVMEREDGSEYEREREGNGGLLAEERGVIEDQMSDSEVAESGDERDGRWQHLDHLLYLAMMHRDQPSTVPRHIKVASSRLSFLGSYVLNHVLAELLLQVFPLEPPAALRERLQALANKRRMASLLTYASLDRLLFPGQDLFKVNGTLRVHAAKSVFHALVAVSYLLGGRSEVLRLLFEVFGFDLHDPRVQPKIDRPRDEDYLHPELDGQQLTWQDVAAYQPPPSTHLLHPRLFAACVPPGMSRFRGSDWMLVSLGPVLEGLAWPRPPSPGLSVEQKQRRNEDMVMALQLAFFHPSRHKREHPRFCYERLEFLGSCVEDLAYADHLLRAHLDAPILWLAERHGRVLRNSACARYLRGSKLQTHVLVADSMKTSLQGDKRFISFLSGELFHAIHGAAYLAYGMEEVRRLLLAVWRIDESTVYMQESS